MWFLLQGRRTTRGYSSEILVSANAPERMERTIPSRKGLPQIGQSIDGFRILLGTRSSSVKNGDQLLSTSQFSASMRHLYYISPH